MTCDAFYHQTMSADTLISISYISLLPCHSSILFANLPYPLVCIASWKASLLTIAQPIPPLPKRSEAIVHRPYDTARSSSIRAHRVTAISMAWVRASWGRTVASGRAFLISSVVGGVSSMMYSFPMSSFERTKFRNSLFSSGDENENRSS